jgi:hypothetical protein
MTQPVTPPLDTSYQVILSLSVTGPCLIVTELSTLRLVITEPFALGLVRTRSGSPSVFATRA